MKNIKNFAIYGLSVCSLSNICAVNFVKLLGGLTKALKNNDKTEGLKLLNNYIFSEPENENGLSVYDCVCYRFFKKNQEGEEKTETLFILFHGLGQSLNNYDKKEIDLLKNNFNADVLLIEYNLNGNKTNTFEDMEEYCKKVAKFISTSIYQNNIFFGYSLGSFVGNLVRKHFNEINKEKIGNNEITSKYIGYKGIKDLDDAGSSFINMLTGGRIDVKIILQILSGKNNLFGDPLNNDEEENDNIEFKNFSDLFEYLLGKEVYNEIKDLTNNASILEKTFDFDKEKVVFNDKLNKKNGHYISLKDDIATISKALKENNDKNVFLFQCKGGDEVVGKGMEETYYSLTGEKKEDKHTCPNDSEGDQEEDNKDIEGEDDIHKLDYKGKGEDDKGKKGDDDTHKTEGGQGEQLPKQQGGQTQGGQTQGGQGDQNNEKKDSSCCCL